jgi:hypothetical protein
MEFWGRMWLGRCIIFWILCSISVSPIVYLLPYMATFAYIHVLHALFINDQYPFSEENNLFPAFLHKHISGIVNQ